jgi:hypothetical protein
LTSLFIANLFISPLYIPYYFAICYYNPYSFIIWINGKNHLDEDKVAIIYKKKPILEKLKTYLKYLNMIILSNALEI